MKRLSCLALVVLFSLVACNPNKSADSVARPTSFKTWGREFVIQPIAQANPTAKDLAHAVAMVRYVTGGSGTGFFVSPDGLFLTNEHILPRERCSEKGCAGLQIVRHLTEDGDIAVYDKFTVLLQSTELDIALAKVELPAGTTVPYLKLNSWFVTTDTVLSNLVVLGHPAGSTLRATEVDFKGVSRDELIVAGPVFWGNSGSPLIDLQSGQVMGVVCKLDLSTNNIDREGNIAIPTRAVRANVIIEAIRSLFPMADFSNLKATDLATEKRALHPPKSLLPEKVEDFAGKAEISVDAFASQFFAKANEGAGQQKLFASLQSKFRSYESFEDALFELNTLSLRSGRPFKFTVEQAEAMAAALSQGGGSAEADDRMGAKLLFEVLSGRTSVQTCLASKLLAEEPYLAATYCRSLISGEGMDVMMYLARMKERSLDPAGKNYQRRLRFYLNTVQRRADIGVLQGTELGEAVEYLARIARDAGTVSTAYRAEAMHALLKKNPALVGSNSFQGTF